MRGMIAYRVVIKNLQINGAVLFDAEFLADVLRNGVLVDKDVHRLVLHESFGGIPDSFVFATQSP